MSEIMRTQIINFMNEVGWYISMEYDVKYNNCWGDKQTLNEVLYPFIGSCYMGGNTVPETAYEVVQMVKTKGL
jgi:hypothetical protein